MARPADRDRGFPSTHWSLVRGAKGRTDEARLACDALCVRYYSPVYHYPRRSGRTQDEAEELTQGFFADFLARGRPWANALRKADDPGRLSFRSCLVTALRSYLADLHRRHTTAKAGGGRRPVSIHATTAEGRYLREPADGDTPDALFLRSWAGEVLDQALRDLKAGYDPDRFDALKPYLTAGEPGPGYADTAAFLGMTVEAVRQAVSRLRTAFAAAVRGVLAQTVEHPDDVDAELRELFGAFAPKKI